MGRREGGAGWIGAWLVVGTLVAAAAVPAWAQEPAPEGGGSHVRAADPRAASLLRRGVAASPTFSRIVDLLAGSDLVVHVETRALKIPGQLQLVAATPACRYVRVSVRTPGLETEQIAWLAHELWHAVELAGVLEVRDQAGLARLYERIGSAGRYTDSAETGKAQETWTKVLYEVRAAK